jgi:hypothetical protein
MTQEHPEGEAGPTITIPTEEIYRNFQNHAQFCKESLIVETEGRALGVRPSEKF